MKSELPELPDHALPVSAGDEPQREGMAEFLEHSVCFR